MKQYLRVLNEVFEKGIDKKDRTGTGTISINGVMKKFKVSKNAFPVITTKKINTKAVINEFIWMVCKGSTDVIWLEEKGHKFWSDWKNEDGTIGKGYGYQFRKLPNNDQVKNLIKGLIEDPYSRRHIIELWNVQDLDEMALPPCHKMTQWFVNGNKLSVLMYQRSADLGLGAPFNITFYSLFLLVVCQLTGYEPDEFIWTVGDCHIYKNHQVKLLEQLEREPFDLPKIWINPDIKNIDDFTEDDFKITKYEHHPAIKLPISV